MHKLLPPLAAAGAVLVGAAIFIRSRRTDKSENYEEVCPLFSALADEAKTRPFFSSTTPTNQTPAAARRAQGHRLSRCSGSSCSEQERSPGRRLAGMLPERGRGGRVLPG
jgi:hypothetical protein